LGSGTGYSVLEVIVTFEKVLGRNIPYTEAPRRPGDMGRLVAVVEKAKKELNWSATKNLEDICRSCVDFINKTLVKTTIDYR
jgi:UDP-glucose 4-epimerase